MYCPNCGSENSKNQNFCRYCGLSLTDTAESLKSQLSFGERAYKLKKSDKIRRLSNRISEILLIGFILGFIAVFLIDTDKTKLYLKFSIATYIIFQIGVWVTNYLQKEETKRLAADEIPPNDFQNREFESKETKKLIEEKPFVPVPTVTENSSELLLVENKTRKFE